MTLSALKKQVLERLKTKFTPAESQYLFTQLGSQLFNTNRANLHLLGSQNLTAAEAQFFTDAVTRLLASEPLQYVLGEANFYGLQFKVNNKVLVPRPETEELVAWILDENPDAQHNILDLCTGSGCIAIALATNLPRARVTAIELSQDAIAVAKENARNNKVAVRFLQADVFTLAPMPNKQDIIVSNPPYVRDTERKYMQANVLDYEPELALFVPDSDPLKYYKAIGKYAVGQLTPNGSLFLEINEYLSKELITLLSDFGFSTIELKHDLSQKPRMIKCKL